MIFKTEKDRNIAYRNTFASNEDRMVLIDILGALGFWDTVIPPNITDVEHNVLNLHAKKILARCGFWKAENVSIKMTKPPKKRGIVKTIFGKSKK